MWGAEAPRNPAPPAPAHGRRPLPASCAHPEQVGGDMVRLPVGWGRSAFVELMWGGGFSSSPKRTHGAGHALQGELPSRPWPPARPTGTPGGTTRSPVGVGPGRSAVGQGAWGTAGAPPLSDRAGARTPPRICLSVGCPEEGPNAKWCVSGAILLPFLFFFSRGPRFWARSSDGRPSNLSRRGCGRGLGVAWLWCFLVRQPSALAPISMTSPAAQPHVLYSSR